MNEQIEVIIAEDHVLLREKTVELLERHNIRVVAQANNGKELIKILHHHWNGIVLLDLNMPVMDGREAFEIICRDYPSVQVIILSDYTEELLIRGYMRRGAKGYVPKHLAPDGALVGAIKVVKSGGTSVPPIDKAYSSFTNRHLGLIYHLCEGQTVKEIAQSIGQTERAIDKQKQGLFGLLGISRIFEFYRLAFTKGFHFLPVTKYPKRKEQI